MLQFHFATVLSPWIRRALIAGGFGIGISPKNDNTSAIPYQYSGGDGADVLHEVRTTEDEEYGGSKKGYEPQQAPAVGTPFFHLDLEGAVRAAESGLGN